MQHLEKQGVETILDKVSVLTDAKTAKYKRSFTNSTNILPMEDKIIEVCQTSNRIGYTIKGALLITASFILGYVISSTKNVKTLKRWLNITAELEYKLKETMGKDEYYEWLNKTLKEIPPKK